jgi:hypothetical protein
MDTKTSYDFTPAERLYLERIHLDYQARVNASISLIVNQQGLPGEWRVKADGSGLEAVSQMPMQHLPLAAPKQEGKKANGLA